MKEAVTLGGQLMMPSDGSIPQSARTHLSDILPDGTLQPYESFLADDNNDTIAMPARSHVERAYARGSKGNIPSMECYSGGQGAPLLLRVQCGLAIYTAWHTDD